MSFLRYAALAATLLAAFTAHAQNFTPKLSTVDEPWPAEMTELAEALDGGRLNDADTSNDIDAVNTMFEFVRDNVAYVPYYGYQRGAYATFLDRCGNDYDQAALLIALLRSRNLPGKTAVVTADFWQADVTYPVSLLHEWFGLPGGDALTAAKYRDEVFKSLTWGNRRSVSGSSLKVKRIRVSVQVAGQTTVFDPAYKKMEAFPGTNVLTAAGYEGRANFIARLNADVDDNGLSIRNGNEGALRDRLSELTTALRTYVHNEKSPFATFEEVFGGSRMTNRNFSSTAPTVGTSTTFSTVTDADMASVTIRLRSGNTQVMEKSLKTVEVASALLHFRFDDSGRTSLWREGDTAELDSETIASNGALTYNLSYPAYGQSGTRPYMSVTRGNGCIIPTVMEIDGRTPQLLLGSIKKATQELGKTTNIETHARWLASKALLEWIAFTTKMSHRMGFRNNVYLTYFAHVGSSNYNLKSGYNIDILSAGYTSNTGSTKIDNFEELRSAFESGVFEGRRKGIWASSAVKSIQYANASGYRNFLIPSKTQFNNLRSVFKSNGWTDTNLDQIANLYAGETGLLWIPVKGDLNFKAAAGLGDNVVSWTGSGFFLDTAPDGTGPIYAGNVEGTQITNGGTVVSGIYGAVYVGHLFKDNPNTSPHNPLPQQRRYEGEVRIASADLSQGSLAGAFPQTDRLHRSAEPVNLATGDYLYDKVDLAFGLDSPRGISLQRSYDSRSANIPGIFGYGWSHDHEGSVLEFTNVIDGLGARLATDAISAELGMAIVADLMANDDLTPRLWLARTLVNKWIIDQLIYNQVAVSTGQTTYKFTRQADGSYTPPPGVTAKLEKINGAFRLTGRYGDVFTYNANGQLATHKDIFGHTLTYAYDATTGRLNTITDVYGRAFTFRYDNANRIDKISDSANRAVYYEYNTAGDLISHTDPDGKIWTYEYDSAHRMTGYKNPRNEYIAKNTYDTRGLVKWQDSENSFDLSGQPTKRWRFYNSGYRNVEENPAGGQRAYRYNLVGQLIASTDELGHTTSFEYNNQGQLTKTTDVKGNITRVSYPDGYFRDAPADGYSITTTREILASDVDTTRTDLDKYFYSTLSTTQDYDNLHRLWRSTDARGKQSLVVYQSDSATDAFRFSVKAAIAPANVAGERLGTLNTYYDEVGFRRGLLKSTSDLALYTGDTASFANVRAATVAATAISSTTAPSGTTNYTYGDTSYGMVTRVTMPTVKDSDGTTDYRPYIDSVYNSLGDLTQSTDPAGIKTSYTYNNRRLPTSVTDAAGKSITTEYDADGNVSKVTDRVGNYVRFEYTPQGRRTQVIERNADGTESSTKTDYDSRDLVATVTPPLTGATTFVYDDAKRLTTVTRPGARVTTTTLDDVGNATAISQSGPNRTTFTTEHTYDSLYRLRDTTLPFTPQQKIKRRYDENGNLLRIDTNAP